MLKQILSVFLESVCPICDRSTVAPICPSCMGKISEQRLANSNHRTLNQKYPLLAWGCYDGQLKRAIALMKYQRQPEIGRFLGAKLGELWLNQAKSFSGLKIVPIPLHSERLTERGYNQAELIAQGFCQVTGHQLARKVLFRVKATQPMFNLNAKERKHNLQDAFTVKKRGLNGPVLLIDDIYTSGATIQAASQALQSSQIKVQAVAVLALAGA